jgi:hypothetical protein
MKITTKMGLATVAAILLMASTAMADKVCLQTTVNKKTFKVTNKTVTAATCPKGYTAITDTPLNLGACRMVGGTCNHLAGLNTCTVSCNNGEFALQYTTAVGSDFCVVNPQYGTPLYSSSYTNGLGAAVQFVSSATCSYQAVVNVLCCPVS